MGVSDIELAERNSRLRSSLMAAAAVILLINGAIFFEDSASLTRPYVRHIGWLAMVLLWLLILATGGWLRLSRNVRRLMNDEVSLLNRSRALQTGFWTAMAASLAVYGLSFEWEFTVREGLRIVVGLAVAAALARYAWAEMH